MRGHFFILFSLIFGVWLKIGHSACKQKPCVCDYRQYKNSTTISGTTKILVVIPGLGRVDRLRNTLHNLRLIREFENAHVFHTRIEIVCMVYIYARRSDRTFWSREIEIAQLKKHCTVIENSKKLVSDNLFMVQPVLLEQSNFQYVMILLDDVKISTPHDFDLVKFLRTMKCYDFTVASPKVTINSILAVFPHKTFVQVSGNSYGWYKKDAMNMRPSSTKVTAFEVSFVEIYLWVMTIPAYSALWSLLHPAVNNHGWGYDIWYYRYVAEIRQEYVRMGILPKFHVHHGQGDSRTDTAFKEKKLEQLLDQEAYYMNYFRINLTEFRRTWDFSYQELTNCP